MNPVVVIGGGMAGLSAAYELTRRNIPFLLLESGARLGGVVFSEQIDGFTLDAGPDALLVNKREGMKLCEELGLSDRLIATMPPRVAFIQRNGKLHEIPPMSVLGIPTRILPLVRTTIFSWPGKIRMGAELLVARRTDGVEESIGQFMTRRFGREATEFLAEPLLAGIHAGDVDRLSMRALFARFVDAERQYGSVLAGFQKQMRAAAAESAGESKGPFRSLPGGLSELTQALERSLPKGSVRLRTRATRVARSHSNDFVVETDTGEVIRGSAVVLAAPAFVTSRVCADLNPTLADLCSQIRYASSATISLGFQRSAVKHSLQGSGFVVPRAERTGILAASWLSSKWPGRAPQDAVLIRTFVGGMRDPDALNHSDQELVDRSLNALRPLLGLTAPPILTRVYRWERATAQYEVGHLDRVSAIERALSETPGLFATGSGIRGAGIPDCVADGRTTAGHVADWLNTEAVRLQALEGHS